MKALLTAAIAAVAALVLGATLVRTCHEPSSDSPPLNIPSTGPNFVFSTVASIHLGTSQTPCPIRTGIHQTNSPSLDILPKDRNFVLSKPAPLHFDKLPRPGRLRSGIYQTYPYTIILMVPGREHDDCGVLGAGNTNTISKMPVITPPMEVIPKS